MKLGKQVSKLMKDSGVSQTDLSRATGIPQPTINRILNEKTGDPRGSTVVKIANFFGVEAECLYECSSNEIQRITSLELVNEIYKNIAMLSVNERASLFERLFR